MSGNPAVPLTHRFGVTKASRTQAKVPVTCDVTEVP